MKYTSAEAAKLLKKLNDDYASLIQTENDSKEFLASVGENVEDCRPAYDYAKMQADICRVEKQIRTVKHAVNTFNLTHVVPGFEMTVDEMRVYIPQLTKAKEQLANMKMKLPRTRDNGGAYGSGIIDYKYINYDAEEVAKDYEKVAAELSKAQLALDKLNSTETFEIELG